MKRRTVTVLALILGATLASGVASAQSASPAPLAPLAAPPASPTPLEMQEAQTRYKEGQALHAQNREEEALIKFRESYVQSGRMSALFAIARTEQLTNHLVESMGHFKQFIANPSSKASGASGKDAAQKFVDELSKQLARITIDAPESTVLVLDGRTLLPGEREIYCLPGAHVLQGTLNGRSEPHDVAAAAGTSMTVKLFDAPPPVPVQEAPATIAPVTSTHDVLTIEPYADAPSTFTTGRKVAVGIGVAAVVAAGVGIGFGVAKNSADSSADSQRAGNANSSCASVSNPRCASLQSASSTDHTDATAATALFIGGGVLAAGAIVVWLLSPPHPVRTGVRFEPALDRTGAGLRLVGQF